MDEVLTTREMAEADRLAMAGGASGPALMDRAGAAVADAVCRRRPAGARAMVVCGPGNNGGDGFVAARVLAARGYRVELFLLGSRDALKGDAAQAAARWSGAARPLTEAQPAAADVVVDALFGAGLARDLDGEALAAVERINASGTPVVAVDVPSGLDGDTGRVRGAAVRASETVTFFRLKPGHLLYPGRRLCGPVRVADIGIPESVLEAIRPQTRRNGPSVFGDAFRAPDEEGHKYGRGHALVVSGGVEATGAPRLAARCALRIGAGLVTVASPSDALAVHAAALTAVMVRRADTPADLAALLADRRRNAVALGPALGVGAETRERVATALRSGAHVVLDADALTSFEGEADALAGLVGERPERGVVVTPHTGEFARLCRGRADIGEAESKLAAARAAAAALGVVVVLKGPDTVVAAPDGRAAINANGTPWLGTAGSGDSLTGMTAGLLAQSVPAYEAACAAVWLHAEAGARIGPGLIAEDLSEALPAVLREYFAGQGA
ncbi:bifunctional ADP-dependent NAD(P)H-hydrate dehydratase/NAD(P)H-hydrate epimerase [Alsobacter soli]|uniref:Bifunctional NAD(P)H-hydrate repair enzyme n=1 Tax=Alsobacter soli TaxID=2109933 RepID=A0A2T1HW90_9HYPH|nr:NAD(P)H-hydrate dehydratase [Alsobacter soli]PSC05769.1 bifunctional ADP-dependent NAD(P)H-hydrate dehydratase/NAD(P)H-hydrate epimerase [Alsobacter soli]